VSKETYERDLQKSPIILRDWHPYAVMRQQRQMRHKRRTCQKEADMSKETYKRDLLLSKETYKRDLFHCVIGIRIRAVICQKRQMRHKR